MKLTRPLSALAIATALAAGSLLAAAPASAHTPVLDVDCDSIALNLTNYPAEGNTVTATLDGVTSVTPFGSSFSSGPIALDPAVSHSWTVVIDSADGDAYDRTISGSSDPDCIPEVVVPEQPEPRVEETSSSVTDCDAGVITTTHVRLTYNTVLVDNVWVEQEPVAEYSETTEPTDDVDCPPVVVPPVEEPPVVTPPVVDEPVAPPAAPPVDRVSYDTLPETGADPMLGLYAALLLAAGGVTMFVARRRARA